MGIKELIHQKIDNLPEEHLREVLDFINSLEKRVALRDRLEATLLSESSLEKDWMRPEEDEAWKDL